MIFGQGRQTFDENDPANPDISVRDSALPYPPHFYTALYQPNKPAHVTYCRNMRYLIIRLFYRTPITSDRRNESVNISGEIPRPGTKICGDI